MALVFTACSEDSSSGSSGSPTMAEEITGPFPKTVEGTIGYSFPLEDGTGRVKLGLLEYDHAAILVSAETYDSKGMQEDDAEVSLTLEPLPVEQCGEVRQCFKGY